MHVGLIQMFFKYSLGIWESGGHGSTYPWTYFGGFNPLFSFQMLEVPRCRNREQILGKKYIYIELDRLINFQHFEGFVLTVSKTT